jgi:hypothetical protein
MRHTTDSINPWGALNTAFYSSPGCAGTNENLPIEHVLLLQALAPDCQISFIVFARSGVSVSSSNSSHMGARVVARREAAIRINGQANRFLQVNFSWTLNQET